MSAFGCGWFSSPKASPNPPAKLHRPVPALGDNAAPSKLRPRLIAGVQGPCRGLAQPSVPHTTAWSYINIQRARHRGQKHSMCVKPSAANSSMVACSEFMSRGITDVLFHDIAAGYALGWLEAAKHCAKSPQGIDQQNSARDDRD